MKKYPTSFQAVDIVVIADDANPYYPEKTILLGKKKDKDKWRFPGGFVDPQDLSLEYAAARELREECGKNLEVSAMKYLFSFRVDDDRYRGTEDGIMSAVFLAEKLFGFVQAGDDLEKVKWVEVNEFKKDYKKLIMPEHFPIVEELIEREII